ncbi:MAG: VanZ family protein [Gallionellaceae bacterium]|nr:VanZ family protein [Gallionellaceae bacterium]MDD5363934.1 VanZ family protein [Gallionellaceae bacterium]
MNTLSYRRLWLAIGWGLVLLVIVLSLIPAPQLPKVGFNDKIEHMLAYFSLMAWFGQIYGARLKPVLALLALGATLEVLQGLSGYREMSGLDMLANTAGVTLGWLFSRLAPGLLAALDTRLP